MELTFSMPRIGAIERAIARSTKYFSHLHRPPKPPLKVRTINFKPGEPEPPDQGAGTLTVCVIQTSQELVAEDKELAFTPAAEPGISTAAAGQVVPAGAAPAAAGHVSRKHVLPSRRTRAATKPAPRAKPRGITTQDLLAKIKVLEARKRELEHRRTRESRRERVLQGPVKPGKGPADKAAGPGRKPRQRERRGT